MRNLKQIFRVASFRDYGVGLSIEEISFVIGTESQKLIERSVHFSLQLPKVIIIWIKCGQLNMTNNNASVIMIILFDFLI